MDISGVNGGIDFAAMRQMREQMMAKIDTNANGSLNLEEFSELHSTMEAHRPDGVESPGSAEEVFAQIDTNGDGEASKDELKAFRDAHMPAPMIGSMSMNSLLMAQEQSSEDRLTSLLDALEGDDEDDDSGTTSDDDNDSTTSYFEDLQAAS